MGNAKETSVELRKIHHARVQKVKFMRVGIYDPYFHILGGAERYILSIAQCLDAEMSIFFTEKPETLAQASQKFGLKIHQNQSIPWSHYARKRRALLSKLDAFFYITDGSLFWSWGPKNILIIQSPEHIPIASFINKIKLSSWKKIVCYSKFVAETVKQRLSKNVDVLFVPVAKQGDLNYQKENMILSVGRFFPHLHNKKQIEMVQIFREMVDEGLEEVRLYLVGSVDPGGETYFKKVQQLAKGLPVTIVRDATYVELIDLYRRSRVYWHAAGFGEDLVKYPERAEHFGVSTIEAMSYKTVPLVFAGGGQTEIVSSGGNGFTWKTSAELKKYTREILENKTLYGKLAQSVYQTSLEYTQEKFCERLHEIIES